MALGLYINCPNFLCNTPNKSTLNPTPTQFYTITLHITDARWPCTSNSHSHQACTAKHLHNQKFTQEPNFFINRKSPKKERFGRVKKEYLPWRMSSSFGNADEKAHQSEWRIWDQSNFISCCNKRVAKLELGKFWSRDFIFN